MTGDANVGGHLLISQLVQTLQYAIWGFNGFQVFFVHQRMDVQYIDMICLQTLQTVFNDAHGLIAFALVDFCGQPDFIATRGHHLADACFTEAIAIAERCVHIGDAKIQRMIQRVKSLVFFFI